MEENATTLHSSAGSAAARNNDNHPSLSGRMAATRAIAASGRGQALVVDQERRERRRCCCSMYWCCRSSCRWSTTRTTASSCNDCRNCCRMSLTELVLAEAARLRTNCPPAADRRGRHDGHDARHRPRSFHRWHRAIGAAGTTRTVGERGLEDALQLGRLVAGQLAAGDFAVDQVVDLRFEIGGRGLACRWPGRWPGSTAARNRYPSAPTTTRSGRTN